MYSPTKSHWVIVKHILRYLEAMVSYVLHITYSLSLSLHGFTNTDWAANIDDQKFTYGYLVFLGTTLIS
jgi:hypothetical protein